VTAPVPAIIATGSAVPEQIRYNDDPIFKHLRENEPPGAGWFTGYVQRRVLGPGETVTELMVRAATAALAQHQIAPSSIDLLLGYGTVSQYITPNTLAQVHAELGLPATTQVLPLADDFTNWCSAVLVADALIRVGRAQRALIVCGDNWTQFVDYATPQAASAGDGAGATVVGPATAGAGQWSLVDHTVLTATQYYGAMYMAAEPLAGGGFTAPWMHITPAGYGLIGTFGAEDVVAADGPVMTLLKRHGLDRSPVTMICHQASTKLLDAWRKALPKVTILSTIEQYANIVLAAIPVNLDQLGATITTDNLLVVGLGEQLNAMALLFSRAS
jgi:3-oxoacyl-[acyl-carrier-protein] synthase-3